MKRQMEADAERMSRKQFCDKYGDEHGDFWDNINGPLDEAGIGQDIVNKTEKMARATTPTPAGKVASTVKNAAKWLAGKGGPGKEGPTYEGADDIEDRGEYDREGDMAKDNIHTIVRNARELESVIGNDDNLPEWVQDKLANIKGMMTAVSEYMQTQYERDGAIPEGTETQWSKEEPWTKVPKSKSGRPVDPRGEVAHMSDVARRETERKISQKKNSKKVAEHGGGIGPKQHWQDLMPEGFQDFNKVEPYAVCLAGKPVKKFDYYQDARRFHDNWKKKLYREGDTEKAEKITLLPLNLDENETPNVKLELLKLYNKAMKAPAGSLIQKRIIAQIDALRKQEVSEVETDYSKRRQHVRNRKGVDEESMFSTLGEDQNTSGVESAIIRRIMVSHLDWLQKFGPEKVMQAAEEVSYNVGDVDEIGTSDVSAYVREVGQILGAID
jgi:hypothetical protein